MSRPPCPFRDCDLDHDDEHPYEVPPRPATDAEWAALPILDLDRFDQENPESP
jgi:hypothetical protein